jgi:hypothetical protein
MGILSFCLFLKSDIFKDAILSALRQVRILRFHILATIRALIAPRTETKQADPGSLFPGLAGIHRKTTEKMTKNCLKWCKPIPLIIGCEHSFTSKSGTSIGDLPSQVIVVFL